MFGNVLVELFSRSYIAKSAALDWKYNIAQLMCRCCVKGEVVIV